jgi:ATP-dependent DNA helicase UvrD/PcrA
MGVTHLQRALGGGCDQHGPSDGLLLGLTEAQQAAVTAAGTRLCVLAGAGSGKTTVLTRRVARRILDGSADADRTVVVTFTRKAATEIRVRLAHLGVAESVRAGTFHAIAYSQLRRHWADRTCSSARPPRLLDDPARIVREILHSVTSDSVTSDSVTSDSVTSGGGPTRVDGRASESPPTVAAGVLAEIHWAKARLVGPAGFAEAANAAGRSCATSPDLISTIYERYEEAKRRRGLFDLDDLIDLASSSLESDPDALAAHRWRQRYVFVDEFQDVNPAQWRLLRTWLSDETDLFVVGDARQAVYGWNGSDPKLLLRLPDLLPGTEVLRLDHNHRSTPQIVSTARAVLAQSASTDTSSDSSALDEPDSTSVQDARPARHVRPLPLNTPLPFGVICGEPSICDEPSGSRVVGRPREDGCAPLFVEFASEQREALQLARWLRRARAVGRDWAQLAVLARTNARLETAAEMFRRCAIPHRVSGGVRSSAEIGETLRMLRSEGLDRPIRCALSDSEISDREVWHLVEEHTEEEPDATVGEFLSWFAATTGRDHDQQQGDRVELTTFHKAKGLEWRAVAVIGLEDGIVPISYATTAEALDEERRLLYVALTRAGEELWCSWAAEGGARGSNRSRMPSRYLATLRAATTASCSTGEPETRARIAELRSRLPAAG